MLTTTLPAGAELPTAGQLISHNIGTGFVASLVLLLLAFSTIANNVPNDYSFALSTQVLGLKGIRRWILTIVGAVLYITVALLVQNQFNAKLEGFLLLIAYWLGAWNAIVLIEHWMRRGSYPVDVYDKAQELPADIAAVASMVIGLEQLARSKGRRRLCKIVRYARVFDRSERALGASGG